MISRVRNLLVYQAAKQTVKDIYAVLKLFPKEEQYALCDQLRRAVISIPSNIAEGLGRSSDKDQAHFLEIAFGSLVECQCQLEIACELGYINNQQYEKLDGDLDKLGVMLANLRAVRIKKPSPTIAHNSR